MFNFRIIAYFIGVLSSIIGIFLLSPILVAIIYKEYYLLENLILAAIVPLIIGITLIAIFKRHNIYLGIKDSYLIVTCGWLCSTLFGVLPFYLTKSIPSFTDAFFETMSGFTTTGASILNDIESLPHAILFWRSIIQWLGGMGIIVLSIIILPSIGGGLSLFDAEAPGYNIEKFHPRIKENAKRLWIIYFLFTLAETLLLWIAGMTLFDALCHSFTTMATGGFSTKNTSIAYYSSPHIQYILIIFMIIAGINFSLHYFGLKFNFRQIFKNEEFKFYLGFILFFSILIFLTLIYSGTNNYEKAFRDSLFQVVSIITTTGFSTLDYTSWNQFCIVILFLLMFIGGCTGSTSGSIKTIRIALLLKNSSLELKRLLHPNAIIPTRFNQLPVSNQLITNVLAFVAIYLFIFISGSIIISIFGYDMESSFGAVASCLGNIGPGLGKFGPSFSYSHLHDLGKWFLSFIMLVGRLELFTVLILFSKEFWKN